MIKFPALSRVAIEAYDHLSLPVWVLDTETLRILSANKAAQSWIEYDAQTLQQMTSADLRLEGDRARIVDQIHRFDGAQADAGTWTIISRSSEHRTASFTRSKVTLEGAEAIVASMSRHHTGYPDRPFAATAISLMVEPTCRGQKRALSSHSRRESQKRVMRSSSDCQPTSFSWLAF